MALCTYICYPLNLYPVRPLVINSNVLTNKLRVCSVYNQAYLVTRDKMQNYYQKLITSTKQILIITFT